MQGKLRRGVLDLVLIALMAALLLAVKEALAFLPNVELVSLLILLFGACFSFRVLPAIAVFVALQGVLYGFGVWWFAYLYIWFLLAGAGFLLLRFTQKALPLALLSGTFGLIFGSLTAIPYFFIGGAGAVGAYIVAGLYFDLIHCAANFTLCLLLWKPLLILLTRIKGQLRL